ncbi:hypothetical protein ACJMK2_036702 [Sinanodonta woodiana]|uniref:RING-type domain-containing protein n=1 Tax=Sinanodonta woodiana TaxID=1069815 RepID=A0ABD3WI14_SINWO
MASTESSLAEFDECPHCHKTITNPRSLPCGHTLCEECLEILMENGKIVVESLKERFLSCPKCQKQLMSQLTSSNGQQNNGSTYAAPEHASSLGDEIIDETGQDQKNGICSEHKQVFDSFCKVHEVFCCGKCKQHHHKKCRGVQKIGDYLRALNINEKEKIIQENLLLFKGHLKYLGSYMMKSVEDLNDRKGELIDEVKSLTAELRSLLKALENGIIEQIEGEMKEKLREIEKHQEENETVVHAIDNALKHMQILENVSRFERLVALQIIEQNLQDYAQTTISEHGSIIDQRISFLKDQVLWNFEANIKQLGTLVSHSFTPELIKCPKLPSLLFQKARNNGKDSVTKKMFGNHDDKPLLKHNYSAVKVGEIDPNSSDDNSPSLISAAVCVSESMVILADRGNKKLKVFKDSRLSSTKELPCEPWDMDGVLETRIVVTLPENRTLLFFEVDEAGQVTIQVSIKSRLECWGVAKVGNMLAVTTNKSGHSVLLLDKRGNEIREIKTTGIMRRQLSYPVRVTSSMEGGILYVCCQSENSLVALDINGKKIFTYNYKHLESPVGAVVQRTGDLFFLDANPTLVHRLTRKGAYSEVVNTFLPEDDVIGGLFKYFPREKVAFYLTSKRHNSLIIYQME